MFKKILLPVDQPEYSEKALAFVKDLALKDGSEVILFNSQDISTTILWMDDPLKVNRGTTYDEKHANETIEAISHYFDGTGIPIIKRAMLGDPASEILNLLENDPSIDLVVMSTHRLNAKRRFLLGSVTNKVVHHAKVPVLVMR
jgi:nucleotide-binding universal stress UspA family protein